MNLSIEQYKQTFPERIWEIEELLRNEGSMESTGTEITKKDKTNFPVDIMDSPWGTEGASKTDLIIPRLLLQQPLSDFVTKGTASPGDIVESVSGEVVAKKGTPVEIIPISTFKTWMQFEIINGKPEYKQTVPYAPGNADWKYEETINGIQFRNDSVINFFVLLPSRSGELPSLVSFRRSSHFCGKKLSTHMQVSQMKKQPPAATVFSLFSELKTVDKNSFWVFNINKVRQSTKEELETAYTWWKSLSASRAKVDDSDDVVPF